MTDQTNRRGPTKPFAARLSLEAHALIHLRALEAGVTARFWLEDVILLDKPKVIARQKPHPDLSLLLFQVNKAGNNLNQIAHQLNSVSRIRPLVENDVSSALAALLAIQQALNEALNNAR